MTRRRPLLVAIGAVLLLASACSGSDTKSVSADGGATTEAESSTPASTAAGGPDVSTAGSTTTVSLSTQCKARGDIALKPGASDDLKLQSGGRERIYRRFIPTTLNPSVPAPLVLNLHGLTSPIGGQVFISGFEDKAEQVGAIVLTPLGGGPGPAWNATRYAALPDDVAFLSDLITATEQGACIDPSRVFAIGMSNGAQMTSQLACSLSDRIAAFATVAGLTFPKGCAPARPVPIIAFHGTADPYLPIGGGVGPQATKLVAGLSAGADSETAKALSILDLAPIADIAKRWATQADGCQAAPGEAKISAHVKRQTFKGCRAGSEVELYVIDGGGHSWPGSTGSQQIASVVGPTNMEIRANDLIWKFLQQHPLPG